MTMGVEPRRVYSLLCLPALCQLTKADPLTIAAFPDICSLSKKFTYACLGLVLHLAQFEHRHLRRVWLLSAKLA
jgi:hypothetical protein